LLKTKGDDVIVFCPPQYAKCWEEAVRMVFSDKDLGQFGLGQILKDFKILPANYFDFCSTYGFLRRD